MPGKSRKEKERRLVRNNSKKIGGAEEHPISSITSMPKQISATKSSVTVDKQSAYYGNPREELPRILFIWGIILALLFIIYFILR
jgi:hypothetical protein